jgi:hypothetical protein
MSNPQKLISRFEKFIHYTTSNDSVRNFLGEDFSSFIMKNYLILAVDLAANGHKKEALSYLILSLKSSKKVVFERTFYAILKHLLIR